MKIMPDPYGGRDPSGRFQKEHLDSLKEDSMRDRVQRLEAELADLRKVYEITVNIVGLAPSEQNGRGQYYQAYLSKDEWPNVRELVQRLLAIPQQK
jgi:hypothetical protein